MKYFLDMNLPIYFCMPFGHPLEERAKLFVDNKRFFSVMRLHSKCKSSKMAEKTKSNTL